MKTPVEILSARAPRSAKPSPAMRDLHNAAGETHGRPHPQGGLTCRDEITG